MTDGDWKDFPLQQLELESEEQKLSLLDISGPFTNVHITLTHRAICTVHRAD